MKLGIPDSVDIFLDDTASSAQGKDKTRAKEISPQARVLVMGSAPAVDWLTHSFGLDLSLISRLGGHSQPRYVSLISMLQRIIMIALRIILMV